MPAVKIPARNTTSAQTRRPQNPGPNPAAPKTPSQPPMKAIFATKLFPWMTALAVVSLIGNAVIYFRFTTLRPLVTVGSKTITKREYLAVLDDAAGKPVLTKLVFDQLARQAAAKAGLMPTEQDITQRVVAIRAHDPRMADLPDYKLREAAISDLALDNLRIRNVQVTDAEVARFYAAHPQNFQREKSLQAALIVTGNRTDAQTVADLLQQGVSPSVIAKQPQFHVVGFNGYTIDLQQATYKNILASLFAMKAGQEKLFPFDKRFLTARVYRNQPIQVLPLRDIRPLATRLARLEKAPSAATELVSLYKSNRPMFVISKYATFFDDIDKAIRDNGGTGKAQ